MTRPSASLSASTNGRASHRSTARARSAGTSSSTSKCPALASTAPSLNSGACSAPMTRVLPVTVTKMSPILAASRIGMTIQPSIAASSALTGSISVTTIRAPRPWARIATPRPHQP